MSDTSIMKATAIYISRTGYICRYRIVHTYNNTGVAESIEPVKNATSLHFTRLPFWILISCTNLL